MPRRVLGLLRATLAGFIEDQAMSRGAAIAFYAFFSVAPLLVIALAIAGLVFGEAAAEGALARHLEGMMGPAGAAVVQGLVDSAANYEAGRLATLVGLGVLVLSASSVFAEVQAALNAIWRAPPPARPPWLHLLLNKLLHLVCVLGIGVVLLLSLAASAVEAALARWAVDWLPDGLPVLRQATLGVAFVLTTLIFALVYALLPNRAVRWRDALVGAVATALLFTAGKALVGWYIGTTGIASTYGAAGSLMAVLLWIYCSAQIFLLGAELIRAWVAAREG